MEKMKSLFLAAFLALSLTAISGCSEKIDTSSEAMLEASVKDILKDKNEKEIVAFQAGYESILNYAYAKTHDGKVLNGNNAMELAFGALLGDSKTNNKIEAMDKVSSDILNGMTYSDVVSAKKDYEEKTLSLVKERNERLKEERAKQAEIDKKNAEIRQQEYERNKVERERQAKINQKKYLNDNVAKIEANIAANDSKIEEYKNQLAPYDLVKSAYEKIKVEDVKFSRPDGKKLKMDLVLNNKSDYPITTYEIAINIESEGNDNVIRKIGSSGVAGTVEANTKKSLSDNINTSSLRKVEDPDSLKTTSTLFVKFKLDDKYYTVDEDGVKIPTSINNNIARANEQKESLNKQLEVAKKAVEDFKE